MIIRPSCPSDVPRLLEIWCRAVDATHHFLTPADRAAIELEVRGFLEQVTVTVAADDDDRATGFMFVHDGHMEALFIDPDQHGRGIGRQLVRSALEAHRDLTTDVNAQNPQAIGFYQHMGFVPVGRSELDDQGRPYPLINLQFRPA